MTKKHTGIKDCPYCLDRKIKCLEVLMNRHIEYPLDDQLQQNLENLLIAVNKFRELYKNPMVISSGYRPGHYNTKAGGAKNSAHKSLEAVDFVDNSKKIKDFVKVNEKVLEECNLYMEHPDNTPTWCHLQIRKTLSGKRIFKP